MTWVINYRRKPLYYPPNSKKELDMKDDKAVHNEPKNPQRRTFLVGLTVAMGSFISVVLGGSGIFYFLSPAWRSKKDDWVEVGMADSIKEGDPVKVDYVQRKKDGWQVIESPSSVWVLLQKGTWIAYDPHCTHLGCPYRWDSAKQEFLCPCHGGVFSKEGTVLSGPPPKPLIRYPTKIENGKLFILPGGVA